MATANKTSYFLKRILPLVSVLFLSSGFYDHTVLTGEIVVDSSELKTGNEYSLYLEIPSELDGIYWITWEVEPSELASINFKLCADDDCGKGSTYKGDRTAVLTALKPGEIEIIVSGYYKQTNPQPVTRKKIILINEKSK